MSRRPPPKKEVLILEHVASEKAGTILDYLGKQKIPYREVPLFKKNVKFPDLNIARALVVMGGPMNVYEEDKYPFLKKENSYIQSALKAGIPYLGVCLGSQLLAKALGARVYKAKKAEVGWGSVCFSHRARRDALFGHLNLKSLRVLQWHEDTFDLPPNAIHLASSALVRNQAYVYKGRFYGFQFHVEVNRPMLETWFKEHPDKKSILSEFDSYEEDLRKTAEIVYSRFFGLTQSAPR